MSNCGRVTVHSTCVRLSLSLSLGYADPDLELYMYIK
jgi:hypothetical protein